MDSETWHCRLCRFPGSLWDVADHVEAEHPTRLSVAATWPDLAFDRLTRVAAGQYHMYRSQQRSIRGLRTA